jgi:hypothetical protein
VHSPTVGEGVGDLAGGPAELGELVGQPAVVGLDVRAAVVRDQARRLEQTQAAQVPGTVQRVEPGGVASGSA